MLVLVGCGRIGFDPATVEMPADATTGLPSCATGCAAGEFCAAPPLDCGGTPACAIKPASCPGTIDPVCGCDGQTYQSECEANRSGISVSLVGACPAPANPTCTPPCAATEFCATPDGVCNAQQGSCEPKPMSQDCDIPVPTCGCDGVTYANPCEAAIAGASILSVGGCSM